MLCKKPYMGCGLPAGCGQCTPCRINRRRLWAHRMMLEASQHSDNSFITLTYDDEHLPEGGTLVPRDTQLWLKRLRKVLSPTEIRYFLVGEYGTESQRPHYHVALFGAGLSTVRPGLEFPAIVKGTWSAGYSYVGDLTMASAGYIAGYVTKKMTSKEDPRLKGRYPEFARMSLGGKSGKGGIGAGAIEDVARAIENDAGLDFIAANADVPSVLSHGRKRLPLGRYLKARLRKSLGYGEKLKDASLFMATAKYAGERLAESLQARESGKSVFQFDVDKREQKILNLESKFKIHTPKGSL